VSRNGDGTFAEGNKFRKKQDFTKEMAKHMVSQELWLISKMVADTPKEELLEYLEQFEGKLSLMAFTLINKMKAGDSKTIQWFAEMMIGKAQQQIEHSNSEGKAFKLSYSLNGSK